MVVVNAQNTRQDTVAWQSWGVLVVVGTAYSHFSHCIADFEIGCVAGDSWHPWVGFGGFWVCSEMGSFLGLKMPSSLSAPLVGASHGRMAPVVTAAGFAVAPAFGYVVLTASASVALTQWQMVQVALQRKRSGVAYPKMYEDAEDSVFNCYQRAHHNTLESYPAFLTLLVLAGLAYPITASAFGMLWVVGRIVYSLGYYTGDPNKRHRGAFHNFGLWGLLVTSIVFGIKTVMPLLSA